VYAGVPIWSHAIKIGNVDNLHICNGTIQIGTTILSADTQCLHESLHTCYSKWLEDYFQTLLDNLPLGMKLHWLYSCVCVLRSEKMVCQSLTEDDQLYVFRGISKGGGNRPGDGQPGFLSKMGMKIFKASLVRSVGGWKVFLCVCMCYKYVSYTHIHTCILYTPL